LSSAKSAKCYNIATNKTPPWRALWVARKQLQRFK